MADSSQIDDRNGAAPEGGRERRFVREEGLAGRLASLAEPVLEGLGFRLVRVVVSGRDGGTVQVMAERPDGTISVEDCALISRNLGPVLDAHDPVEGSYRLEVSSPGIDRPLVRPSDFASWAGHEARIELKSALGGRRRFRGVIEGFSGGEARLIVTSEDAGEPQVLGFAPELIDSARLVLTDELVRAALQSQARGGRKP